MVAVFDKCPVCMTDTTLPENERSYSVAVYRACRKCRHWRRTILAFAIIIATLSAAMLWHASSQSNVKAIVSVLGILLTIIGGYLLFFRFEELLLMATTLGGFTMPEHQTALRRQTGQTRTGLLLILLGLFLQVVGAALL